MNRLLHGFHRVTLCTAALLCISLPFFPQTLHAQQSKTYSFTPTHAKNYVTTGNINLLSTSASTDWYDPAWQYRQKITINKDYVGEDLTDFPVVVRLDETLADKARDDRYDLVFTSSDGTTPLAYEREDNSTIWVKVPTLTPTEDTVLYLYYGNPTVAEDQARPAEVWTNGYAAVYHMNNNPEGPIADSTTKKNTGISHGTMEKGSALQDGKVSKGLKLDGTDDYLQAPASQALNINSDQLSTSMWVKFNALSQANCDLSAVCTLNYMLSKGQDGDAGGYILYRAGYGVGFKIVGTNNIAAAGPIEVNKWYHLVGTYNGSVAKFYLNGNLEATAAATGPISSVANTRDLFIGQHTFLGCCATPSLYRYQTNGTIDDVRVASSSRSSAWIAAEYANQSNTEDFLSISPTVESSSTGLSSSSTPTITLKSDRPLPFSSLSSFTVNNGGATPTFQLSNDAGTTWLFYTKDGWKGANPKNPAQSSSAPDISKHLTTFPKGSGKLLWKAYLGTDTTLDQIQVTYQPATHSGGGVTTSSTRPTSLRDPRITAINDLFTSAFHRPPTYDEWLYWTTRLINGDKGTQAELLGAMEWRAGQ